MKKGSTTQPKRHHWIPRFYLKWFATEETLGTKSPQVYIFNRISGEPLLVSTKNIAVKNYLYAPLLAGNSDDRDFTRETELAELEGFMSQIWPKLACDFVDLTSEPFRKGMSLFLATLFLRHPYTLKRQRESRQQIIRIIESAPKDKTGDPQIGWIEFGSFKHRIPFDVEWWHALRDANENDEHRVFVDMIRAQSTNIAEGLMRKRWSIIFMDEPFIVTSDNPFFVMDPDLKRDQVLGPEAKLMFPISPTRVLCLDDLDEPGNRYYKLSCEQASLYNMLTWVNTDDYMISSRPIDDVLEEITLLEELAKRESTKNR